MSAEITKYDEKAIWLYDIWRTNRKAEHFYRITRRDRDYWRGLAQVCIEDDLWPLEGTINDNG